jgi:hypothetical protein
MKVCHLSGFEFGKYLFDSKETDSRSMGKVIGDPGKGGHNSPGKKRWLLQSERVGEKEEQFSYVSSSLLSCAL